MTRLVLGVILWSIVHCAAGFAPDIKKNIVSRYGDNSYKGIFALLMIVALYLIISGWGSLTPVAPDTLESLYITPEWGDHVAGVLVLIGFILFLAPYPPNNIKRMLRHPQLVGMVCWGAGHLVAIGTVRSLVLFGGLSIWSLVEIFLLNRNDGAWTKPDKVPLHRDIAMVSFSVLVYMAFLFTHHRLFGGSPLT